jgi:hypothetical protein
MARAPFICSTARAAASLGDVATAAQPQSGHVGIASHAKSAARYGSRSASVASVERLDLTGARRSTATVAATGASESMGGRSRRSRNWRA